MNTPSTIDIDLRRHRAADVTVTVRQPDGTPLANQQVLVTQRTHHFVFGGNGHAAIALANDELHGSARERAEDLCAKLLDVFNAVTLPFYWGRFEPQRGR